MIRATTETTIPAIDKRSDARLRRRAEREFEYFFVSAVTCDRNITKNHTLLLGVAYAKHKRLRVLAFYYQCKFDYEV
jgi:hypothetical protein